MIEAAPLNGKEPPEMGMSHVSAPVNGKEPILNGALGGTRTPDTLVRSQVLYPAELRAQWGMDLIFCHLLLVDIEN